VGILVGDVELVARNRSYPELAIIVVAEIGGAMRLSGFVPLSLSFALG
jgi:hypothetical protein